MTRLFTARTGFQRDASTGWTEADRAAPGRSKNPVCAQTPHGPYADKPGWVCYRGESLDQYKRVHCDCKPPCKNEGREDVACQVYRVPHDEQARFRS